MSDVIIRAEGLGKKYRIRHQRPERDTALRDVISHKVQNLFRRQLKRADQPAAVEDFWALKDVSFEIRRAEIVGIVGRNGAGKSTLLKVLSRITEPTTGRVELDGRVASLLEVGTGFHGELSGRENIYLNGVILGMPHAEIRRKFDEIVAFAEVEKFLDTPVKRYSSGMYVRLAFAIAAHLEPDILIVDEVLAVGDAQFQKKCLGKMQDVSRGDGRTILFVSHNMSMVRALCSRGIVLHNGHLEFAGSTENALVKVAQPAERLEVSVGPIEHAKPSVIRVDVDEREAFNGHLKIDVEFTSPWPLNPVLIGAVIHNRVGTPVFGFNTTQSRAEPPVRARRGSATLRVRNLALHSGTYRVTVFLGDKDQNYDVMENAAYFDFISPEPLPPGIDPEFIGAMRVSGSWKINVLE
jgi:lipopolysaccharide transport system ATP-binding protein